MAETTGLLNRRTGHSVPRVRISSSPQPATAQRFSAGLFWYAADASSLVDDVYQNGPNDRQVVGCCIVARTPAGGPEMPQAQRSGISSILTSSSRQTAAHRHPLWTYKTPHPVRQGPISGNGAPQPPAQRTEAASQCGCLAKSVIVDFFQGHLERSRGHFFCIDRRELFDFDLLL